MDNFDICFGRGHVFRRYRINEAALQILEVEMVSNERNVNFLITIVSNLQP